MLIIVLAYLMLLVLNLAVLTRNLNRKLLAFLSPSVIVLLFDMLFYLPFSLDDIPFAWKIFSYSSALSLAFLASFIFFSYLYKPNKAVDYSLPKKRFLTIRGMRFSIDFIITVTFFFLALVTLVFIFARTGIPLSSLAGNAKEFNRFYSQSRTGGAYLYFILSILSFSILYSFLSNGSILNAVIFFVLIIILSVQGGRGALLNYVIMLAVIFSLYNARLSVIKLMPIFLGLVLIFGIASYLRTGGETEEYMESEGVMMDFNLRFAYVATEEFTEKKGVQTGMFIKDFLYMFIPRSVWKDKPTTNAETDLIFPDASGVSTILLGVYGNAILNFGIFGIIIVQFLYMLLARFYVLLDRNRLGFHGMFVVTFLLGWQSLWLRGGLFQMRIVMVLLTMIAGIIVYKFSRTIIKEVLT